MALQLKQQLIIDWGSPLTRLLLWNAVPALKLVDLVSGGVGKLFTSGSWGGTSSLGKALKSTSTTNGGAYWPWSRKFEKITNKVTIIVFAKPDAIMSFSHFFCIPAHSTWTSPYACLSLTQYDTSGKLNYQITASGVVHNTSTVSSYITAGDPMRCYGVSVDGAVARFFVDGLFKEQVTLTNTGTIDFQDKVEVALMNRVHGDAGEGLQGLVPWAGVWGRNLSDNEMAVIAKNPFRIYKSGLPFFGKAPVGAQNYTKTLTDTFVFSEALTKSLSRTNNDSFGLAETILKSLSRALSDTFAASDTIIRSPTKVLTDTTTPSESLTRSMSRSISDTTTPADTLAKQLQRSLTDSGSISDSMTKMPGKSFAETMSLTDTIVRQAQKVLTDTVSLAETLIRALSRALSDVVTLVEDFAKYRPITVIDSFSLSDTIARQPQKVLTDQQSLSDSITRLTQKNVSETLILVEVFSAIKTFVREVSDSFAASDTIVKSTSKTITDSFSLSEVFSTITTLVKELTDTITMKETGGAVDQGGGIGAEYIGGSYYAGTLDEDKQISFILARLRTLTDSISLISTITVVYGKIFSDILTITDRLTAFVNGVSTLWTKIGRTIGSWTKAGKTTGSWDKKSKTTGEWTKQQKP